MIAPENRHLSDVVERLLADYLVQSSPDPIGLRQIVRRVHALPILQIMTQSFAIRPSGEIISFSYDTPDDIRIETDARLQRMALYQGSLDHPALRELIPARPADAVDCPFCEEIREIKAKAGVDNILCYCGGMEWLTPDELRRSGKKLVGRSWFSRLRKTAFRRV
jgi:hypothetical protein